MIVHVHTSGFERRAPAFISFVDRHFSKEEHRFWMTSPGPTVGNAGNRTYYIAGGKASQIRALLQLSFQLNKADKIVLHGMFDNRIVLTLWLMPWLAGKTYWVLWGGDYFIYKLGRRNIKWKIREAFRRPVIRRMGYLITYIEGSVRLVRAWYGAQGTYLECLAYPNHIPETPDVKPHVGRSEINVLVGNSADPGNRHIEVFEMLRAHRDKDLRIYVPLSSGDKKYAAYTATEGRKIFGDRFVPIIDQIEYHEYIRFLSTVDIAIFNHERHQAMGTIIALLASGAKVFIRPQLASWDMLERLGVEVFDVNSISERTSVSNEYDMSENKRIVRSYFSYDTLVSQWRRIFDD